MSDIAVKDEYAQAPTSNSEIHQVHFLVGKSEPRSFYVEPQFARRSSYLSSLLHAPPPNAFFLEVQLSNVDPRAFGLYLRWLDVGRMPFPSSDDSHEEVPTEKILAWSQCFDLLKAHIIGYNFIDVEFQNYVIDTLDQWLNLPQPPNIDVLDFVFAEKDVAPQLRYYVVDKMFAEENTISEILKLFVTRTAERKCGLIGENYHVQRSDHVEGVSFSHVGIFQDMQSKLGAQFDEPKHTSKPPERSPRNQKALRLLGIQDVLSKLETTSSNPASWKEAKAKLLFNQISTKRAQVQPSSYDKPLPPTPSTDTSSQFTARASIASLRSHAQGLQLREETSSPALTECNSSPSNEGQDSQQRLSVVVRRKPVPQCGVEITSIMTSNCESGVDDVDEGVLLKPLQVEASNQKIWPQGIPPCPESSESGERESSSTIEYGWAI